MGTATCESAEVHREARRHDNALLWAEKGLKAFPDRTDARLREFAADEYHRRGRHDEAMKLTWTELSERPFLETYKTLEKHAKRAGAWPEWRERALGEVRVRIGKAKEKVRGQARPRWIQADDDHSVLVEIFLHEGKNEDAWREAAAGGCSNSLWLRLAAKREKDHPERAAPIYLKYAEAVVAGHQQRTVRASREPACKSGRRHEVPGPQRGICASRGSATKQIQDQAQLHQAGGSRNGRPCTF